MTNFNAFIESKIIEYFHLSKLAVEKLCNAAELITFRKNETLQEEGKRDHYIYIIIRGLVKSYIHRGDREVIIMIDSEGQIPASSTTIGEAEFANFTLKALEETSVIRIARKDVANGLRQCVDLAEWGRRITEEWLRTSTDYYLNMYWLTKKEQYQYLLNHYPSLIQRLSVSDMAHWLNITPQSLSRIRAEFD